MSDLSFVFYSLRSKWLNSLLSILLTAFGVSIAIIIIQFADHLNKRLISDGKGIDIVVGAKGSPLQLVLSSVYHIDIPNGNIDYNLAKKIIAHPQIKKAIPLALGDNWRGYRIVGTTLEYMDHYKAEISEGRAWTKKFETVIGSSVKMKINDEFQGAHGLMDGGSIHENIKYKVTGIMKNTGTVLDRLILTSLDSVLEIHGHENINNSHEHHKTDHQEYEEHGEHKDHGSHEDNEEHAGHKEHEDHRKYKEHDENENQLEHNEKDIQKNSDNKNVLLSPEITAFLITTKSPISNINLPRLINKESNFQAANPALEIIRLISMLGFGSKSFTILSIILISFSALSIFSGLAGNLENRMGDLSILRAIGYSKNRIFKIITLEGMIIVLNGLIVGIIFGLGGFLLLTEIITPLNISHASFNFNLNFFLIILTVFIAGFIASIFPAYRYSKISLANQLSRTT